MDVNQHYKRGETKFVAFADAPPYIREIIDRVLKLEQDQLYSKRPRVIDDVEIVVRRAVKNRSRETSGSEE